MTYVTPPAMLRSMKRAHSRRRQKRLKLHIRYKVRAKLDLWKPF
jgi:hypothetical protein